MILAGFKEIGRLGIESSILEKVEEDLVGNLDENLAKSLVLFLTSKDDDLLRAHGEVVDDFQLTNPYASRNDNHDSLKLVSFRSSGVGLARIALQSEEES